jgi:hypothetical protein
MIRSGLLLSVGVDSGWIPHFCVACAFFVPMMFETHGEECEGAGCSYHMVLLQRLLPLPQFLMHDNVWMVIKLLLTVCLFCKPVMNWWDKGKMTVRTAVAAIEDPVRCYLLLHWIAKFLIYSQIGFSIGISHFMKSFSTNMTISIIPDQQVNPDEAYASPPSYALFLLLFFGIELVYPPQVCHQPSRRVLCRIHFEPTNGSLQ